MHCSEGISLYRLPSESKIENCIASTPETRSICNDPGVAGCEYTRRLCHACRKVLELSPIALNEKETVVVNILRGGLNYGLRDALADAYGWNTHTTCFISAQRARNSADSEDWHITENDYAKVYFPEVASLVIGDVVATGTSLRYALQELLRSALEQRVRLRSILFFTFGGSKASDILEDIDRQCRELFPGYEKTVLVFFEGCFTCAEVSTPLSVRLTGTDLLRWHATMAPRIRRVPVLRPGVSAGEMHNLRCGFPCLLAEGLRGGRHRLLASEPPVRRTRDDLPPASGGALPVAGSRQVPCRHRLEEAGRPTNRDDGEDALTILPPQRNPGLSSRIFHVVKSTVECRAVTRLP